MLLGRSNTIMFMTAIYQLALVRGASHDREKCYFAHCEISKINGSCTARVFNKSDCSPNIEVHLWRNDTGGSERCKKEACCLQDDLTPSQTELCILLRPRCKNLEEFHGCACKQLLPTLVSAPALVSTNTMTSYSPTTQQEDQAETTPHELFNQSTRSPAKTPVTFLVESRDSLTTSLASTQGKQQHVTHVSAPFTSTNETSAARSEPSITPAELQLLAHQTIYNITYILQEWPASDGYHSAETALSKAAIGHMFDEVERALREFALQSPSHNVKFPKCGLSDCGGVEVYAEKQNCSAYTESYTSSALSTYNVTYKFIFPDHNGSQCDDIVVAISQFQIRRGLSKSLLKQEDRHNAWSAQIEQILLPHDMPYLSLTGHEVHHIMQLAGNVEYTAKLSVSTILEKDIYDFVYRNEDGDTILLYDVDYQCAYVNTTGGEFSFRGLERLDNSTFGPVRCKSNHTTVFALLLSLKAIAVPWGVKVCSYVTESLSILFLIMTVIVLCIYKNLINSDRTCVQINLSLALLFLHVCSLVGDVAVTNDEMCVVVTVATHFFLIATAMWMLVEGIRLALITSEQVFLYTRQNPTTLKILSVAIGWIVPIVMVTITAAAGMSLNVYMTPSFLYKEVTKAVHEKSVTSIDTSIPKYSKCWLDPGSAMYYASVVAPISAVLIANLIIAIKVTASLIMIKRTSCSLRKCKSRQTTVVAENVKTATKALLILIPVLGIPWAIGFLAGIGDYKFSVVIMYVNAIVNGLQGVIVFVLYCVANPGLRSRVSSNMTSSSIGTKSRIQVVTSFSGKTDLDEQEVN